MSVLLEMDAAIHGVVRQGEAALDPATIDDKSKCYTGVFAFNMCFSAS